MMTPRETFDQALKTSIRDPYDKLLSFDIDFSGITLLRLQADLLRDEGMFQNLLNTLRTDLPTRSLHISLQPDQDNGYNVDERFARIQDALQNVERMQIVRVPYQEDERENGQENGQENDQEKESSLKNSLLKAGLGVGTAIAFPFLFTAGITALGFTTTGILGGSGAAWLMSLYGGNVASGSVCAVLQSIGAAGLGATGTAVASTTGAVVGGAGASMLTRKSNDKEKP